MRTGWFERGAAVVAAAFGAVSLGVSGASAAHQPLAGVWAGDRATLILTEEGGRLQFDCGYAILESAVTPNAKGRFRTTGVYFPEQGGPAIADRPPPTLAARLEGVVAGANLSLTFQPAGGGEPQTYNLVAGQRLKPIRCL